ncbi:lipopolysaccharide assembly protein LapA domain-containing protein [Xanthobacter agilis]|uniref:Integral membrane protein n=1 Tax=Xanthobacter agilis TaxID=47492 RepID=A0ABU0L9T2_XANAG|nr:lipopolysaccharide assembly protein LapA domain-containing protein [Xanthobacter agilis]MDQ0503899.1 putative integral membrane protein [Xanthobacter agilis]
MARVLSILIGLPLAVLVIALAVANRRDVLVSLDPFSPNAPVLAASMPLYVVIFGALIVGVILGGAVTWVRQGRFRREARYARRAQKAAANAASSSLGLPAPRA